MKYFSKLFAAAAGLVTLFTACDKVDDLPIFGSGVAPVLTSSVSTIATPPADSLKTVVTFNWTSPKHATDTSNYKFILQIDSTGKNFAHPQTKTVVGTLSTSLIGKELNNMLLNLGFAFNTQYDVDVRVVSSYGNNNEQIMSNTIKLKVTPYKIPPKVPLPTTSRLFIVGDATDFGWTNPAPMPPIRELTRLDETTWGGIFHLSGSGGYLLLPLAGDWGNKFSVASPTQSANAGDFGFNLPENFPGNVSQGNNWYKMIYDFQQGKYLITKVDNALSPDLYVTGDATAGGWVNNPPAAQKFTMLSSGLFEITLPFVPGKAYKFLNTSGQWQPQFGGSSATGGVLGANYGGGADPDAVPTPAIAGNYKITVNFITMTYTVVKV